MRVECPKCEARVHVDELPEEGERIRCLKCGAKFRPPEPDDEDDDDYEEDRRRSRRSSGSSSGRRRDDDDDDRDDDDEKKKFPVVPVVAGSAAVLAVVGIAIGLLVATKDPKKEDVAQVNPPVNVQPQVNVQPPPNFKANPQPVQPINPLSTSAPKNPVPTKKERPKFNPRPPRFPPPAKNPPATIVASQYADLFAKPVDNVAPPTVRAASLNPTSADKEPEVPTFYSLMMARKAARNPSSVNSTSKSSKLTIDEIKRACTFIKVEAGPLSSSGSGFLISWSGRTGLIATNHHVIKNATTGRRFGAAAAVVTVIFNSGMPDEHQHKADIVGFDAIADVAILKVQSNLSWPKPLSPFNMPPSNKVIEGLGIQFWGFPLGDILARGNKNPEITLGTGTLAGFQHGVTGKLERLKISGTMNPGNSGGPIVDSDGRLVGLAVAIINPALGTGIGFAVPVNDLIALLEGKLLPTIFVPTGLDGNKAKFLALAPVMDPLDKVDTVFIRRWAGDGKPPEVVKDPLTGHKPFAMRRDGKANLPGVEEFPLKKYALDKRSISGLGVALGEMTVPLDAGQVLIQVASQTNPNPQSKTRLTAASKPVPYTLTVSDMPVGTDARPFAELTAKPDALEGQVIVVRGQIAAPPVTRDAVQDLVIVDTNGKAPPRMKFLVGKEDAAEYDEVEILHQSMDVRLVCMVGKRGSDGVVPVRILRADFIGRGDRIVRSIPGKPLADQELADLNRHPENFAGKSISIKASTVPVMKREAKESTDLHVIFSNQTSPRNVSFNMSKAMKERMRERLGGDLAVNAIVSARLSGTVAPKPADPTAATAVTVTKVELLDREGKAILTIQ
ncbi:MAG TPA: trypsin-like peptidase domain-containing protein [Urbifossiella sp.]|nr:trypsin-like peptidase domain-containing protein [Urbifossiella sp.]